MSATVARSTEVTRTSATFTEIYARNESRAWCRLLYEDSGRVIILSDYGDCSHCWWCRGEGVSVPKFLAELEMDYMGRKMLGAAIEEYSHADTVKAIREKICFERSYEYLTKEEAREEWDRVGPLEENDIPFDVWVSDTSLEDAYECRRTRTSRTWVNFWEKLWLPLIQPELAKLP